MARRNKRGAQLQNASEYSRQNASGYSRTSAANTYTKKRKSRGRHKVLRTVIIVIALVLVGGVGVAWAYINNIDNRLSQGVNSELLSTLTEAKNGEPFYMLLLGIDKDEARASGSEYGEDNSAYRSDSIMLARIDPGNDKVTLVSIPRDTYVDLGKNGKAKINAAYSFGGAAYATEVVSKFAGVSISHYAEIDMDGMAAVVDAVGGVDVDLPIPVKDPNYTGLDLPAGEQHLDGTTAALLCRTRHAYDSYGGGDFYRAANQRMVIAAVAKKVLASDPVTMANTISEMANMVSTDLSVGEIVSLATQMSDLDVEKDIMSGLAPTTSVYTNDTWYEICDVDAWQTMMERVDAGESPLADGETDQTSGVSAQLPGTETSSSSSDTSSSDSSDSSSGDGGDGGDGTGDGTSSGGTSNGYTDGAEAINYAENYNQ